MWNIVFVIVHISRRGSSPLEHAASYSNDDGFRGGSGWFGWFGCVVLVLQCFWLYRGGL